MFLEETGLDVPEKESGAKSKEGRRFYLPNNGESEIIFLTDADKAKSFWEHKPKINGSFKQSFTCLRGVHDPCPLCEYANEHRKFWASFCTIMTVQNISVWSDKDGKEHTNNSKELLVLKKKSRNILAMSAKTLAKHGKGLRGAKFCVQRSGDEFSPGTGDVFTYIEHVDLSTLEDPSELNYAELLAHDPEGVARAVDALNGVEEATKAAETYKVEEAEYSVDDVPF